MHCRHCGQWVPGMYPCCDAYECIAKDNAADEDEEE